MERDEMIRLLITYAPEQVSEICKHLSEISDEFDTAKSQLAKAATLAMVRDNYDTARTLLAAQETINVHIGIIQEFINDFTAEPVPADPIPPEPVPPESPAPVKVYEKEPIDYDQFNVDNTIAYNITDTIVTFKKPAGFSLLGKAYTTTTWRAILVKVCDLLYSRDPAILNGMVGEKKRSGTYRVKITNSESGLTSPAAIPGSRLFIEKNRSAETIRLWIIELLRRYGIPAESMNVYLRRDLTELHREEPPASPIKVNKALPPLPDLSLKVGIFIKTTMENLSAAGYIFSDEMMNKLCAPNSMQNEVGLSSKMPFFKLVDPANPDGYKVNGRNRYYRDPMTFGSHTVYLNSQLFDKDKEPFVNWYLGLPDSD